MHWTASIPQLQDASCVVQNRRAFFDKNGSAHAKEVAKDTVA
jgi:hypothetical protein